MNQFLARRAIPAFKDGILKDFEKLRLNFSKCNPSLSPPSATTESSKKTQCSYLVLSKQTSSLFFSFHRSEHILQHSEVDQNSVTEPPYEFWR